MTILASSSKPSLTQNTAGMVMQPQECSVACLVPREGPEDKEGGMHRSTPQATRLGMAVFLR
jgi:hypothetical protein